MLWRSIRRGSSRSRRGCSKSARSPASTASSPMLWRRSASRCASSSRRSTPEANALPNSSASCSLRAQTYAAAADKLSARTPRRGGAARCRGDGRAASAEARFREIPHCDCSCRAGPVRHRPGRVRSLDQSRRAVRTVDPNRVGRRAVALHPRSEGRARRGRHRGDDDLRRGRSRGRRRGCKRDRRAAGAACRAIAGPRRHPFAAGRRARVAPLPDREDRTAPDGTRTTVRKLDEAERREEIARMLSGAAITDEARAQASRLLDAA